LLHLSQKALNAISKILDYGVKPPSPGEKKIVLPLTVAMTAIPVEPMGTGSENRRTVFAAIGVSVTDTVDPATVEDSTLILTHDVFGPMFDTNMLGASPEPVPAAGIDPEIDHGVTGIIRLTVSPATPFCVRGENG
jgi:hypothetical protein